MYRLQRSQKRQVIITTHSADLLSDQGDDNIRLLLEGGLTIADAALPQTVPLKFNN